MILTSFQIELIKGDIRQSGVELKELEEDLLDHICCILEEETDKKSSFEEAYQTTKQVFFPDGYREIQEQTNQLITQKFNNMKKVMNIIGIAGSGFLMIGSIMKSLALAGSNELILLGVVGLTMGYLPMLLILALKKTDIILGKFRSISGFIGAETFTIGVFFQVFHLPFGKELILIGLSIILIIFLPLLVKSAGTEVFSKLHPATAAVLLLAVVSTFFAFSNKKTSYMHRQNLVNLNENIVQSINDKKNRISQLTIPEEKNN